MIITQERNNMERIKVAPKAQLYVYWSDLPEKYSREDRNKVRNYFASKYNVPKNNINVIFQPLKLNEKGEKIEITGAGIDNILDVNYQQQLFKQWIEREKKTVDFDRLLALDAKVNESINFSENTFTHRTWSLKQLAINNFLCFGENVNIPFTKLRGLSMVTSEPKNMGGKTSFSIEALLFLFFGTTTKTDRNEDIFNRYSDKDILSVRGLIDIDGDEYIIERVMTRSAKRDGTGYTIKNTLNYYEILPDGEEKLLDEEHAPATTKKIVDSIGSENDFMTTILATADNLSDLIETQATARGKLLNRFIGLEVIEQKEAAVRAMYNAFAKTMKSNTYNIIDLQHEIDEHNENIGLITGTLADNESKLGKIKSELIEFKIERDKLLSSKQEIDKDILKLDPVKLNKEMDELKTKGQLEATNLDGYKLKIEEIGQVSFDEVSYNKFLAKERELLLANGALSNEIKRLEKLNTDLANSEICPTCKRHLDGVDNSGHIKENNEIIATSQKTIDANTKELEKTVKSINKLKADKELYEEKNKLEIKRDRCDVEVLSLRTKYKEKKNDLAKYQLNVDSIEFNRKIDIDISGVDARIIRHEADHDTLLTKIERCKGDIEQNKSDIETKDKIIETIKKEDKIEYIYKIYIDMVGKRGISKIVLRSVLPIINFELHRLLNDVVDFDVELEINSKNDLDFLIVRDGIKNFLKAGSGFEKTAASLALRCVLGRISSLPKPNFIAFDEVFGKVADENLEYMRLLFDKIRGMFDSVLLITHNTIIRDWADNIITFKKIDNITSFSME